MEINVFGKTLFLKGAELLIKIAFNHIDVWKLLVIKSGVF